MICADEVRSALESAKGVKSAKVSLEKEEAIVVYDPAVAKEDDLIQAVRNANGMHPYDARVKTTEK
ncbi:MAG: heavy-metal-associated domain-containing protein [Acidobacteria bacterium]|nr:heavy-metal-associated domain-containing protein [Acidobacteriota bacterium]